MVVHPHDGDEQVTHAVAHPRGPQREQGRVGGFRGRAQFQHEHRDQDGEDAVGKEHQAFGGGFAEHGESAYVARRGGRPWSGPATSRRRRPSRDAYKPLHASYTASSNERRRSKARDKPTSFSVDRKSTRLN